MIQKSETSQKPVSTREWYDFIGQLADFTTSIHIGGPEATRMLLDMCQLDATSHVLDVGCGSGNTACLIAQQYGSRVLGVDISVVMIAKATERARRQGLLDKVEFRVVSEPKYWAVIGGNSIVYYQKMALQSSIIRMKNWNEKQT